MPTKIINLEFDPYQWDFYTAINRFPGFIAGVGTGKTMDALFKGDLFSRFYKNNLGIIIRNKFTDLRDSTMKDFTFWTGKHVPQGTKEAHYANGSTTLFRHAKELSGLKNVNLGWGYIEQAEEFPTDTQFQLLRFRLRRDLEVDEEYWEQLVKAFEKAGEPIYPFLQSMHDKPLNQLMTIANANGHNWCWKLFIKSPGEEYSCIQANSFDNTWLKENKPETIADWRRMETESPAKFNQYVMNCHDEVDLDACYWASRLSEIRKDGHMGVIPHNPDVRVHLAADVGLDCTAIWFFQLKDRKRLYINYYENTGKFADHYARILDEKKSEYGYNYGKFVMPKDANKREQVSQMTFSKSFKDLGYDVVVLDKTQNLDIAINNANNGFKSAWFDENKCELGLEALFHYRRRYDEELRIFLEKPLHDWASHPASSIIYSDIAISKGLCGTTKSITKDQINKWNKKYRRTG
ncbi:hypothetical protein LCGC14_1236590 [marine sediment metagenome]|uniref:Phage terminase large subunit N-terminal domain-containing protein n=1 Tax=marine sediment metagenome TaxID=412755 RepID=A0A0F9PB98_9ZZZZ